MEFDGSETREGEGLGGIVFDVRRWKVRSGKRAKSENQRGDVPWNYIRFERGGVVERRKQRKSFFFCRIQGSRGIDNCELQCSEKVDARRLSSAE